MYNMIGYDEHGNAKKLSYIRTGMAGAASGCVTRFICQPLDVIKIVFQLQIEPASHQKAKYRSIRHATMTILKDEGMYGLWKGHSSAQLLSIVFGMNQFIVFGVTRDYFANVNYLSLRNSLNDFLCGTLAGGFATFSSFPFDVVRTRVVAQANVKVYRNTTHALYSIYVTDGYRGLYRGFGTTLIQAAPYTGAQFLFYNLFSRLYRKAKRKAGINADSSSGFTSNMMVGFFAGLCAKTAVYPFDLCRKRLQIQGFQHVRGTKFGEAFVCDGFFDCVRKIYHKESLLGFYKGLNASLLKAAVVTALHFATFEYFSNLFKSSDAE